MKKRELTELKVKICSLMDEARVIRREENRFAKDSYERFKLRQHRVIDVRREARAAQLAYGFLRGMPYAKMEAKTYEPIDLPDCVTSEKWENIYYPMLSRVRRIVIKFGSEEWQDKSYTYAMLSAWFSGKLLSVSHEPNAAAQAVAGHV